MKEFFRIGIFKIKKEYIFIFFMMTVADLCSAQQKIFIPAVENESTLQSLSGSLDNQYREDIRRLPSENRKDYLKIYKQRWDYLQEKLEKKEIYTEPRAQQYLHAIVEEIVKSNPLLQGKKFQCYFSRSGIPNAETLGEGLILFNMGLFSRLDNESQAAFILCHELAHFYLQHGEKSIEKYVTTLNSDEVQRELRHIKKATYGKRVEIEKLLKGLTFDSRRHGRDHESSADSMGVEFMRHTRFDISASLTALALLDSIDKDTLPTKVLLHQLFNAPQYPFREKWVAKEEGLLGGHAILDKDEELADSLKTHPDCKIRIKLLEPMVAKYRNPSAQKEVINTATFEELKKRFRYEAIVYAFESDHYTLSLLYTLQLIQNHPDDPFLVTQIGKIFNGLYAAQKSHTLGKVADLPAPYFEPNYNLLLQFIENLYSEDYAAIGYYYLKSFAPKLGGYSAFKTTFHTSSMNQSKK